MKNKSYYIWSRKWTEGWVNTFWRPGNCGYTIDLNQAGIYSKKDIGGFPVLTRKNIKKLKYSKSHDTFCIAVEDVELLGKKMVCILN